MNIIYVQKTWISPLKTVGNCLFSEQVFNFCITFKLEQKLVKKKFMPKINVFSANFCSCLKVMQKLNTCSENRQLPTVL